LESVLTVVAWVVIAISFSITFEVLRRFLGGGADLPATVLQGLIALVSGGVLVRAAKLLVAGTTGEAAHDRLQLTRRTRLTLAVSSVALASVVAWSSPWIARTYNDWGARLYSEGKLSDALEKYRRAISLQPSYAVAHYNIGNVYEDVREYDNAISEYKSSIMADSEFYAAYNNLARLYILHRKDYVGALQLVDKALALNVDAGPETLPLIRFMMYKNRGWADLELKYYSQAREDLEESLRLRDDGAEAYCLLAEVLEAQQDKNGAVEHWKKCQELGNKQADEIDAVWLGLAREKLK
jgi:tetratricopeptide (TPR) repeat protein